MSPTLPEIRIRFSFLLYNSLSEPLSQVNNPDKALPSAQQVRQQVDLFREAWALYEKRILIGLCDVFGLKFYQPVIDAFVSPHMPTMSTPLLLSSRYQPDYFVDVLAHELIHILINDNTTYSNQALRPVWDELYQEHDRKTANHILVHAGLKHLFLDVLKEPSRLERNIEVCQQWPDYAKSWSIVQERGYQELITEFKAQYPRLTETSQAKN